MSSEARFVDRTALVTGATAGIGFETARTLARAGARVLITGRNPTRGEQAAAAISAESRSGAATFLPADHATIGGNQDLADRVLAAVPRLDLLINNVGGLYATRWETTDGYEATLAMNFLGPQVLIAELLPSLRAAAPSRCLNVVSAAFKMWKPDPFSDLAATDKYVSGDAYAHTKLLNVLAGLAWARRLAPGRVTVNAVHPGLSWTSMTESMTAETMPSMRLAWPLIRLLQRRGSPARAGRRVADLATSQRAAAVTGQYFEGGRTPSRLSARVVDERSQDRAWQLAAELTANAPTNRRRRALGDAD